MQYIAAMNCGTGLVFQTPVEDASQSVEDIETYEIPLNLIEKVIYKSDREFVGTEGSKGVVIPLLGQKLEASSPTVLKIQTRHKWMLIEVT